MFLRKRCFGGGLKCFSKCVSVFWWGSVCVLCGVFFRVFKLFFGVSLKCV